MSHYRSNVRDLEFNLFEVLGAGDAMGVGPFAEMDAETARGVLHELEKVATGPIAASFVDADRNPPVYDPKTFSVTMPESFKKSFRTLVDGEWFRLDLPTELGGYGASPSLRWAAVGVDSRRQPGAVHVLRRPELRRRRAQERHPAAAADGRDHDREAWGSTMVLTEPDAGSDVGAGRTKAILQPDGTWHLEGVKRFITSAEQDLTDNIVHLVLARPEGPGIESRPGTKGLSLFVVPKFHVRPGDRRAGRAQRRLRHRPGTQDGAEGFDHLRAQLRHPRHPGRRIPVGRQARWHRADVPGDRVRPDDGRHQGDRHAVHRLPERPGLRQAAGAERGPDQGQRQDRPAGDDHPPPGRPADPDEAEGLRGGPARGLPVHRRLAGQDRRRRAERRRTAAPPSTSTTCCCRSSRASARSGRTRISPCRCRSSAGPATPRTTRSSSTSGTPRSTPCTRAPRRSRPRTSSSARSSRTAAPRSAWWPARSRPSSRPRCRRTPTAATRRNSLLLGTALADVQAMVGSLVGYAMASVQEPTSVYKVGEHAVSLLMSVGDLMIGYLLLRQAVVAQAALDDGASAKDTDFYAGKLAGRALVRPERAARADRPPRRHRRRGQLTDGGRGSGVLSSRFAAGSSVTGIALTGDGRSCCCAGPGRVRAARGECRRSSPTLDLLVVELPGLSAAGRLAGRGCRRQAAVVPGRDLLGPSRFRDSGRPMPGC